MGVDESSREDKDADRAGHGIVTLNQVCFSVSDNYDC